MSQIHGKNTKPELRLRKALWSLGLRYRLHYKIPGKPDIVFVGKKVVVFVDGCFWHGCKEHGTSPKTNHIFWNEKIKGNILRDQKNDKLLKKNGWKVLRLWEHELKKTPDKIAGKIYQVVTDSE